MTKAVKIFPALMFLLVFTANAYAAAISDNISSNSFVFTLTFDKGYSNVDALKNDKEIIVTFETTENISYERQDFFDLPVKSAWLTSEGTRQRLFFSFEGAPVEPVVTKQPQALLIEFPLPPATAQATSVPTPSLPGIGAYLRMFFGLAVIIAIILAAYAVMRIFFKNSVVSDIPGAGRMLGKVDLELKKSLVFYELGETVYIMGVTDGGINLLDKITDPVDVNLIKSGFSRRKDFSSYLKFFRKKNEIAADMNDSSDLIGEKLSSVRKK